MVLIRTIINQTNRLKAIWLDAAQCGTSEIMPLKQTGDWSVKYSWTSNLEADIMGAGGHIHDGKDLT
jgi:hypothetical protein